MFLMFNILEAQIQKLNFKPNLIIIKTFISLLSPFQASALYNSHTTQALIHQNKLCPKRLTSFQKIQKYLTGS